MKVYIINLARSTERRAYAEREMEAAGLDYRIVDAVDGHQLTPQQRSILVDEEVVAQHPRWLTPGMIGCSLSHHKAYQQIVEDAEELALVVEDDVVLRPDTPDLLRSLERHMRDSEVVLLYYRSWGRCLFSALDTVDLHGGTRLAYPMDVSKPETTAAYVITNAACVRMTDVVLPVRAGPDSWGFFHDQGGVDHLRCVVPRAVGVRTDFKSTIDYLGTGVRQRASQLISRRRVFPLYQLLHWKRRRWERHMSRFELVEERSPLARD